MTSFDIGEPDFSRIQRIGEGRLQNSTIGSGGDLPDFGEALTDAIKEVNSLGKETRAKAEGIARGEPIEVHELMISMGKSDVAFNLMLEVRNKIIDAWQTLSGAVI